MTTNTLNELRLRYLTLTPKQRQELLDITVELAMSNSHASIRILEAWHGEGGLDICLTARGV